MICFLFLNIFTIFFTFDGGLLPIAVGAVGHGDDACDQRAFVNFKLGVVEGMIFAVRIADSEAEHGARDDVGVVGEVFGAHGGVGYPLDAIAS